MKGVSFETNKSKAYPADKDLSSWTATGQVLDSWTAIGQVLARSGQVLDKSWLDRPGHVWGPDFFVKFCTHPV